MKTVQMKMNELNKKYDELQEEFGASGLNSVYGCGRDSKPKVALVFMNPTKRNIATSKVWTGLKAQWLGTKQIWEFLVKCNLFDDGLVTQIKAKKTNEWTPEFCDKVYNEVKQRGLWITNLAKCTQEDARPLPDSVFEQYQDLLKQELSLIKPEKIFFFGNQVSSIMLGQQITVSTARRKKFNIEIEGNVYECYAVFYPVGNGRFNQAKAVDDIVAILNESAQNA